MIRTIVFSVLLFISISVFAQTTKNSNAKIYNRAVAFSESEDFNEAIKLFKRVADDEPENINVMYNLGHCYLNINDGADSAQVYFKKAADLLEKENYYTEFGIDLFMSLAKSEQLLYHYDDAIKTYEKLLGFIEEEHVELRETINREIQISKNGIEFMKNPVKLEVHNLGKNVNSKYDDHSPLVNADESALFFTSRRISSYSQIMEDGQFSEKVFTSVKEGDSWSKSEILKSVVDLDSHEAGVCLSADGTELYMLISNIDGQNLYVSEFDGESWSEPFKLPEGINSRYNETHASINADKSILFFTSDRKGGYGGLDIYMVRKLPNGEWGVPRNLGPDINTEFNEETPMIHPNGKILYFSSEGHNTMGKFDIFYSRMNNDSTWSEPVNMGYPINTPDDDFFFVPTATSNKAYMASSRFEDNYGGSDLYMIEYEEPMVSRLAVIKGQLKNENDLDWENLKIIVREKGQNELVGEYKANPGTGMYLMILEANKSYDITYQGANIMEKKTQLDVTNEMTYHNKEQSIYIDDVLLQATPEALARKSSTEKTTEAEKEHGKYTVQFVTLKELIEKHPKFSMLDAHKITVYKCKDGKYRYVFGDFDSFKEAKKAKQDVIQKTGYDDSFVRYFWQLEKLKAEDQ